jgi:hypothetical protein
VKLHRARKSASRRLRASSARAVRRAGSSIEQQWSVLNTARDTSCYTRHEAVLVSCCTTLTIAHSDAFRAHDDHTLAERVDSQDTAEYALSRSSSLDDDARSGSPPRPRRTRTARRRVNNRKGYLRELVGGHWRRKAHCKRSIDALACVCKQEELARPDLFEPPVGRYRHRYQ